MNLSSATIFCYKSFRFSKLNRQFKLNFRFATEFMLILFVATLP